MLRRSLTDKEFFVQDWFEALLSSSGYAYQAQGRNSTPDYLVKHLNTAEGYEVKSLANVRTDRNPAHAPCRTDVDFNSSIPCGYFVKKRTHRLPEGIAIPDGTTLRKYYLFVLYEPLDAIRLQGIAFVLADGNYLNNDLALAEGHRNVSEGKFGSYGDAFVRVRQMYRFPNPLTEPDFRYRMAFVTQDPGLDQEYSELRFVAGRRKTELKTGIEQTFYVYEVV